MRTYFPTFGSKQITLYESRDPEPTATKCIYAVCETKQERTTGKHAVKRFFQTLFPLIPVKAVAFVTVNSPSAPTTLKIVFLLELPTRSSECEPTMLAISEAFTRLSRDITGIIATAIGYADLIGRDVSAVADELEQQWENDPQSHLIRLVHIRRAHG